MKLHYDTVIIGSGFGGSITACRLAQAQRKAGKPVSVCILERGRRYNLGEFPRTLQHAKDWWWRDEGRKGWTGLLDFRNFDNIGVLQASGVGGTSLVYLHITIDAFNSAFQTRDPETGRKRWPESVPNWVAELQPYYRKVEDMLRPSPVPEPVLKTRALKAGAAAIGEGHRFRFLDVATYWGQEGSEKGVVHPDPYHRGGPPQAGCRYCGECYIGCNTHSKSTLDLNYLWFAEQAGAEVYSQHRVKHIERIDGGYRINYEDVRWRSFSGHVTARRVILAGGSLGSTELLLRAKLGFKDGSKRIDPSMPGLSDMVGRYFSGNGDFGAMACETTRETAPTVGPVITATLDYGDLLDGHGFLVEDGAFPDVLRAVLERLPGGLGAGRGIVRRLVNLLRRGNNRRLVESLTQQLDFETLRDGLPFLVMGHDAANGLMALDEDGQLTMSWKHDEPNMRFFRTVESALRRFSEARNGLDGNLMLNPTWSVYKHLVTVHPLGGCPMGDDISGGVVNTYGEVFGYPGLYVVDGAIVPSAIGPNPSKTIAALAERAVQRMIQRGV